MFGVSNLEYAPHGDSTSSCHIVDMEAEIKKLIQRSEESMEEQRAKRARIVEMRNLQFDAIQNSIGHLLSIQNQSPLHQHQHDQEQSDSKIQILNKYSTNSEITATIIQQKAQIDLHNKNKKFISTNPEIEIHQSRNSNQASEEVSSDNQYNRDGGLTTTMMMPTTEAPTKTEQDLQNNTELRGDSGPEFGASARGTTEEAVDLDSGSGAEDGAFAERTKKMTSCDGELRLEETRTRLVHRVSPIVTKPLPLMVAVFPWDCEVRPRKGKKHGRAASDAPFLTVEGGAGDDSFARPPCFYEKERQKAVFEPPWFRVFRAWLAELDGGGRAWPVELAVVAAAGKEKGFRTDGTLYYG